MLERIAAIFSVGWKKWQNRLATIFLAATLALAGAFFAPTHPAAALDDPTGATTTEDTSETSTLPTQETTTTETTEAPDPSTTENTNCDTQLGAIGWFVCPTTGAIARGIDYIYNQIIAFIKVDPITTDRTSATFIVWEYARSITNVVFVIFIIIIIISQLTGLGLTNYGIKKALPRIVIAAVLVNLSFIVCTLAVDVSNVLGFSLHNFFNSVALTISNSSTADLGAIASISWSDIITGIVAGAPLVGAAGTVGLAIAGGTAGLIFLALPLVVGAIIAVFAAILTLAARQALITLLIMLAPLAIVAYLLPNTESLFKKWRDLLIKLLVFFPMFSALFGASQLAGWAIISGSGGNGFVFLLGMAVQVFPLIFAPTLLKMSGTVLGKVNELARRPFAPAQKALASYAADRRRAAAANHLANSDSASASVRRYLNNRRIRREEDTAKYEAISKLRGQAFAASDVYNRRGQLSHRGEKLYKLQNDELKDERTIETVAHDFDKGLDEKLVARNKSQLRRLATLNDDLTTNSDLHKAETDRGESIKRENAIGFAKRMRSVRDNHDDRLKKELDAIMSRTSNNDDQSKERLSNLFASAQHAKNRADSELTDKYSVLFSDTEYTDLIDEAYKATFDTKNYSLATAALREMFTRGDVNLIEDDLMQYSDRLVTEGNLPMQKSLNDVLVKYKADDARLSQFAKSNNIRRAKNFEWQKQFEKFLDGHGSSDGGFDNMDQARAEYIADFADYSEYFGEKAITRTFDVNGTTYTFAEDTAHVAGDLMMENLVSTINDPYIITTQDRNVFKWAYKRAVKNDFAEYNPSKISGFNQAQFIRGFCSGKMDGEQLENMTMLLSGGFNSSRKKLGDMKDDERVYFEAHKNDITSYITKELKSMTGNDLQGMKTVPLFAFDNALMAAHPTEIYEVTVDLPDGTSEVQRHSTLLKNSLATAISSIQKNTNLRSGTKPMVKQILGIKG